MNDQRPTIAISAGDPLGIGPEITVKALADHRLRSSARFLVFGLAPAFEASARAAGITPYWSCTPRSVDLNESSRSLDVLLLDDPKTFIPEGTERGPDRLAGAASYRDVEDAINAALLPAGNPRHADAIVTAPISKTAWNLAGITRCPGHTELLAERFGAEHTAMMFVGPILRVVLVTIHVPLARVPDQLTTERVARTILLTHQACVDLALTDAPPRIAVCGLNPHAGEDGLLGNEDLEIIKPAVDRAASEGVDVTGPHPADTLFLAAARRKHDVVIAMYHDQGLTPIKLMDAERAVNLTIGLPHTIRTSPAHGTAFDIAGRNAANPESMTASLELAIKLASRRARGSVHR